MHPDTRLHTPDALTAGRVHLLRQVRSSERPDPPRIAPPERRVVPGGGVVIGLLLSVPVWACIGGIVWGLHVAGVLP